MWWCVCWEDGEGGEEKKEGWEKAQPPKRTPNHFAPDHHIEATRGGRQRAPRTKRSVDEANSRSSVVEAGERTCRSSDVRDP